MRLERVTDIGHKMFEEALQVYRISFPFILEDRGLYLYRAFLHFTRNAQ